MNVCTIHRIQSNKNSGKDIERASGSEGHNKKWDDALLECQESKINADSTKSMLRLSKELKVDPKTVRTAVHEDLGMKSYVRVPRQLLTSALMEKRLERCKKIRN